MILSKVYDPADLHVPDRDTELTDHLITVDRYLDDSQHWSRRWEYAMALKAFDTWERLPPPSLFRGHYYDVGGFGSPFNTMLKHGKVLVIDPKGPAGLTLAQEIVLHPYLADAVFCISVIEHVQDLDQFLYHLGCLVAPGGLLFLTTDFQPDEGPDNKHFHWMRERIFTPSTLTRVTLDFRDFSYLGEQPWGTFDASWHGPIENWGYAPASLALVKRR